MTPVREFELRRRTGDIDDDDDNRGGLIARRVCQPPACTTLTSVVCDDR